MRGRDLAVADRADLLLGQSNTPLIAFVRIDAPRIRGGVALVADTVPHLLGGVTYQPIGLGLAPPEDSDQTSPRQSLVLPNIDRRIGEALRRGGDQMTVSLAWYSMRLFDLTAVPRVPLGAVRPFVEMIGWRVVEVSNAGGGSITVAIERRNIEQEPFPHVRATADIAPGLHR